ncbi:peptidoglycan DD-metalloendopeptidase family protein [bacterium]|nr:peptidoglycan DD-metalloendopeptidase family protein [bacterium]
MTWIDLLVPTRGILLFIVFFLISLAAATQEADRSMQGGVSQQSDAPPHTSTPMQETWQPLRALNHHENNLREAQKIIDAAKRETTQIRERNKEREFMFSHCLTAFEQYHPPANTGDLFQQFHARVIKEAVTKITLSIFEDIQAETPRLQELEKLIHNREAYQHQIMDISPPRPDTLQSTPENNQSPQGRGEPRPINPNTLAQITEIQQKINAARETILRIRKTRAKKERGTDRETPSTLESQKGTIPWPARGPIIRPFGEFTHPRFNVTMLNPGMDMLVDSSTEVRALAEGIVVFNGSLPAFGPTIIISHGDDYFSVYANVVSRMQEKQSIQLQQKIGIVENQEGNKQVPFHFEIHKGESPLNPLQWLAASSDN